MLVKSQFLFQIKILHQFKRNNPKRKKYICSKLKNDKNLMGKILLNQI